MRRGIEKARGSSVSVCGSYSLTDVTVTSADCILRIRIGKSRWQCGFCFPLLTHVYLNRECSSSVVCVPATDKACVQSSILEQNKTTLCVHMHVCMCLKDCSQFCKTLHIYVYAYICLCVCVVCCLMHLPSFKIFKCQIEFFS